MLTLIFINQFKLSQNNDDDDDGVLVKIGTLSIRNVCVELSFVFVNTNRRKKKSHGKYHLESLSSKAKSFRM